MAIRVIGERGVTGVTLQALAGVLTVDSVKRATITVPVNRDNPLTHGFILEIENGDVVVVADGFASGYSGTGPHGLVDAFRLFHEQKVLVYWSFVTTEGADDLFGGRLNHQGIQEKYLSQREWLAVKWKPNEQGTLVQFSTLENVLFIREHVERHLAAEYL